MSLFVALQEKIRDAFNFIGFQVEVAESIKRLLVLGKRLAEHSRDTSGAFVASDNHLDSLGDRICFEKLRRSLALVLDDALITDGDQGVDGECPKALLEHSQNSGEKRLRVILK